MERGKRSELDVYDDYKGDIATTIEFDFKLHKRLWVNDGDENLVFHARKWCDDAYDVSFTYDGKDYTVGYSAKEVEKYIDDGSWIVICKVDESKVLLKLK